MKSVIGQEAAIAAVSDAVRRSRAGISDHEKPLGSFLFLGPTGVGKTEIARRLAKLANSPFIKVEATKFTEVGYVGRDVDSIIRDLLDVAIAMIRKKMHTEVHDKAAINAKNRVLDALVGYAN